MMAFNNWVSSPGRQTQVQVKWQSVKNKKKEKKGEHLHTCTLNTEDMSTVCAGSVRNGVRKLIIFTAACVVHLPPKGKW